MKEGIYRPLDFRHGIEEFFDVVIIGSGAGGAVSASIFAREGKSVALLEEGGYFTVDDYKDDYFFTIKNIYRDAGGTIAVALPGRPPIPLPLGRCVGGTTVINSGTCFRIPERIIDTWNRKEGLELDLNELEEYYEEIEKKISIRTITEEILGENAKKVKEGALKLGLHPKPLKRNITECKGCGRCAMGCPRDAKRAMHITYIPEAIGNGAVVFSQTKAKRILIKGDRALGVEAVMSDEHEGVKYTARFYANKVVLSCGAIHTPALFSSSGLKTPSRLEGKNLRIHPGIRVYAEFEDEIKGWNGVPQGLYIDDYLESDGLMFEGVFLPPEMFSISLPYTGKKHTSLMERYPYMSSFGAMLSETSSGIVKVIRGGTHIFYHLNDHDAWIIKKGVEILSRIYFEAGAKRVFTGIFSIPEITKNDFNKLRGLKIKASHIESMAFHPTGTMRMSSSPLKGVVDGTGKVYGFSNLYIADGSIIPGPPSVNPMEGIMAFSMLVAYRVLENW